MLFWLHLQQTPNQDDHGLSSEFSLFHWLTWKGWASSICPGPVNSDQSDLPCLKKCWLEDFHSHDVSSKGWWNKVQFSDRKTCHRLSSLLMIRHAPREVAESMNRRSSECNFGHVEYEAGCLIGNSLLRSILQKKMICACRKNVTKTLTVPHNQRIWRSSAKGKTFVLHFRTLQLIDY